MYGVCYYMGALNDTSCKLIRTLIATIVNHSIAIAMSFIVMVNVTGIPVILHSTSISGIL